MITLQQCRRQSDDCHYHLTIKNNSDNHVYWGRVSIGSKSCRIEGYQILAGKSENYQPFHNCIESELNNEVLEILIIDPKNIDFMTRVDCDTIQKLFDINTILRTYVLTLEDLERMDYTINYPEDASIGDD